MIKILINSISLHQKNSTSFKIISPRIGKFTVSFEGKLTRIRVATEPPLVKPCSKVCTLGILQITIYFTDDNKYSLR